MNTLLREAQEKIDKDKIECRNELGLGYGWNSEDTQKESKITVKTVKTEEKVLQDKIKCGLEVFNSTLEYLKKSNSLPNQKDLANLFLDTMPEEIFNVTADSLREEGIKKYMKHSGAEMFKNSLKMQIDLPIQQIHESLFEQLQKRWVSNGITVIRKDGVFIEKDSDDNTKYFLVNLSWK